MGCATSQYTIHDSRYTIQRFTIQRCMIHAHIIQTCVHYIEKNRDIQKQKNISAIHKDQVSWLKKTKS